VLVRKNMRGFVCAVHAVQHSYHHADYWFSALCILQTEVIVFSLGCNKFWKPFLGNWGKEREWLQTRNW